MNMSIYSTVQKFWLVRLFCIFLKEVFYTPQGYIYLYQKYSKKKKKNIEILLLNFSVWIL